MNHLLEDLRAAIAEASTYAHISGYLPNLQVENPAQCLLLYVTQPSAESEPGEHLTVETPVEIGLRMAGGLKPEEIVGVFPLHQADEAVCLLQTLLEELAEDGQGDGEAGDAGPEE